jgi:hypothetical protein
MLINVHSSLRTMKTGTIDKKRVTAITGLRIRLAKPVIGFTFSTIRNQ